MVLLAPAATNPPKKIPSNAKRVVCIYTGCYTSRCMQHSIHTLPRRVLFLRSPLGEHYPPP
jgi:hypothetical protein